jgi:hypothetical protein
MTTSKNVFSKLEIMIFFKLLFYCVTVEKYKTPKETAMSAGFQNIVWYTNAVIKIVYTVH